MTLNLEKIRSDFPILKSGLIYLDNAASTLTPESVLAKMLEYYREYRSNVERGLYGICQKASDELEQARKKIAGLIGAKSSDEIVIVRNTTEGINAVANGLRWNRDDKIVTTLLEHHSNFLPWLRIAQHHHVKLEVVRPNHEGILDVNAFEKAVDDKTRIVAVTHVSNALGVIVPVGDISKIAHEHNALCLVDGAQSVPHIPVNVVDLGSDFLAFSGHKMFGPTGCGALYIKSEHQNEIEPHLVGGGPVVKVRLDSYTLTDGGRRFEAGTPPIAEAIGLGAAVDYLKNIGLDVLQQHESRLTHIIQEGLSSLSNVTVYGPNSNFKTGITSFNIQNLNPHDVALALDTAANIALRSGHHCAQPLMNELLNAPEGTVRASVYAYNTEAEVEKFLEIIAQIAENAH